jgi:hypothetical protein
MADEGKEAAVAASSDSGMETAKPVGAESVTDSDEANLKSILEALGDEKWDFRTVDGLSKTTGIDRDVVLKIIEAHPDWIRKSAVPDRKGRPLHTLRSRSAGFIEILASARAFITKST